MKNIIEELYIKIILEESKTIGIISVSDNQFRIYANRAIRAANALKAEQKRMEEKNES